MAHLQQKRLDVYPESGSQQSAIPAIHFAQLTPEHCYRRYMTAPENCIETFH